MLVEESVRIPVDVRTVVDADLVIPYDADAVVVFAHGSGSSRRSPRNRAVAAGLHDHGFGTLLLDLLTGPEEAVDARTGEMRFDIDLLSERLAGALTWLAGRRETSQLSVGLFGASTGAAAALVAAARRPASVGAVVSRGGRPDLAGTHLAHVRAPTLLIVGGRDETVLGLNREAMARMSCMCRLEVVPGATHLFEEPGALDQVTRLAADHFDEHLHSVEV